MKSIQIKRYGSSDVMEVIIQHQCPNASLFEEIDLPAWIFGLADDKYQRCSPAHVATGATHSPDSRRMAINVEVLGGRVLVSHSTEEN